MARITLSRNNITWTIDVVAANPVVGIDYGQYCNGDWWVRGTCTVVAVSPATITGATTRNGSMLNISASSANQGHDSRESGGFLASLTVQFPVTMNPGDCLVSNIGVGQLLPNPITPYRSVPSASFTSITRNMAILTCELETQSPNAFRPSYVAGTKYRFHKTQINWNRVPVLPVPSSVSSDPGLTAQLLRTWAGPWVDHVNHPVRARDMHPMDQMEEYGSDIARCVNDTALWLALNIPQATKEPILIGFLQWGIDLWGLWKNGRAWSVNGGQNPGRLLPMILMGWILNYEPARTPIASNPGVDICEVQDTYLDAVGTGWWGGKSLARGGTVAPLFEETAIAGWTSSEVNESDYMWCCRWDSYAGMSLVLRLWSTISAAFGGPVGRGSFWGEHWPFYSCVERWRTPLNPAMHAAWAGTGSGIGTRGGTGANFSHPYMDEMWDGWSAALHHNPWITRRPGGFETPGVHPTLILNKPPSFVGEHAFEIHHCPQAVGALIMGRLQDPVIVGGARMWTNHVAPLASFPINRNGYNVATVVVPDMSIPILGGTSLPSLVIQAVWTGAAPEMASDAFIWQINPLVPTGA